MRSGEPLAEGEGAQSKLLRAKPSSSRTNRLTAGLRFLSPNTGYAKLLGITGCVAHKSQATPISASAVTMSKANQSI